MEEPNDDEVTVDDDDEVDDKDEDDNEDEVEEGVDDGDDDVEPDDHISERGGRGKSRWGLSGGFLSKSGSRLEVRRVFVDDSPCH